MSKTIILAAAIAVCVCTTASAQHSAQADYPSFLDAGAVPDITAIVSAPPDTASALFCADRAMYEAGKLLRATPRGRRAVADAALNTDSILSGFAVAMSVPLSAAASPATHMLVSHIETDASNATVKAKRHYMRKRPYVQFGEPTLIPAGDASHRLTGSFPSSHAAIGWATALVLAEICPDCQDDILRRGYDYGQSRVIAGYHYQSDVDAARLAASAVVARLHADRNFMRQLQKARREIAKARRAAAPHFSTTVLRQAR